MACILELIKHQERTLGTTPLLSEAALSGLGDAGKTSIHPKESQTDPVQQFYGAETWAALLLPHCGCPTQDQAQILSRRKRMDRL